MAGWIKLHRSITDSDIYQMPPLYLRVFERLIIEANHQDNRIPFKFSGDKVTTSKLIKRGERQTSIRNISDWVGWYEYGIFKKPNTKTIKEILDWLEANNMIEIYPQNSNREGTHYKIVNYNDYQDKDEEKVTVNKQSVNSKETVTGSKQECYKNDKECLKNVKEENKAFSFYQDNGFGLLNKTSSDYLIDLEKEYTSKWLLEAMEEAVKSNARNLNYVKAILKNWKANGKRTYKGAVNSGGETKRDNEEDREGDFLSKVQERLRQQGNL